MKTRTSWRNQERLWKALGKEGAWSAADKVSALRASLEETVRALREHIIADAKRSGVALDGVCPCSSEEIKRAEETLRRSA